VFNFLSDRGNQKKARKTSSSYNSARNRSLFGNRLRFELLEERQLLSVCAWRGGYSGDRWSDPANWSNSTLPVAGDTIGMLSLMNPLNNDLAVTPSLAGIIMSTSCGWIYGNPITLRDGAVISTSGQLGSGVIESGLILNGTVVASVPSGWNISVINSTISGSGGFYKDGAGMLTLGSTATYTGATTIVNGTLRLFSEIPNSILTVNGGVVDINGTNVTVAGLSSSGASTGMVVNNFASAPATLTVAGNNDRCDYFAGALKDYSGASGGTLGLTVTRGNGAGGYSLFLSNSLNTYSGTTSVSTNGSYVSLVNNVTNALSSNSSINVGAFGEVRLNLNNAQIAGLEGSGGYVLNSWSGPTSLATLTINNPANKAYSGNVVDYSAAKLALVKTGGGTETLSGNNSYSGGTTVNAGTLQAGSSTGFPANSVLTINGGVVDLNGNNATARGLNSNGSTAGVVANNFVGTSATLTVAGDNDRSDFYYGSLKNYSGASGGALALAVTVKAGSIGGYSEFLCNSANTYSGTTSVFANAYYASLVNNVTNALSPNSSINVGPRGEMRLNFYNAQIAGLEGAGGSVLNSWAGTGATAALTINNTDNKTFSGTILDYPASARLALVKTGSGRQTLTGTNTYTGGTTISQGVLQIGTIGGSTGSVSGVIHNNATLHFASAVDHIFANDIDGVGSLVVEYAPTKTLRLTGNLTYTGGDLVLSGALIKG
jgi:fibronectin-binding autotransporter adhesin